MKVSLLNFAITFSGLEDQLLGVVVVEEMPEMQEKKNSLGPYYTYCSISRPPDRYSQREVFSACRSGRGGTMRTR